MYQKLLDEMRTKNGINERLIKQSVEANRHNSITSHYYLLMKQKILDGESLEKSVTNRRITEIITASGHHRVNKSVLGNRTT